MSILRERVDEGFEREYARLMADGLEKLLATSFQAFAFDMYRRGYVLGHSDRTREYRDNEQDAERAQIERLGAAVRYEAGRLSIDGRDVGPPENGQ